MAIFSHTFANRGTAALRAHLGEAARYVGGLEKRVRVVEERNAPRHVVSEEQADTIKAAVSF